MDGLLGVSTNHFFLWLFLLAANDLAKGPAAAFQDSDTPAFSEENPRRFF